MSSIGVGMILTHIRKFSFTAIRRVERLYEPRIDWLVEPGVSARRTA